MAEWYDYDAEPTTNKKGRITQLSVHMGAEYRFVPLHHEVAPAPVSLEGPKDRLSHFVRHRSEISGRISFKLKSQAVTLFGSQNRARSHADQSKETPSLVEHSRLYRDSNGSGPFAAPGHAVRGMIRSVFGIATFSRFDPLNGDHRFFSRNMDLLTFANRFDHLTRPEAVEAAWLRPAWEDNALVWRLAKCVKPFQKVETRILISALGRQSIESCYREQMSDFDDNLNISMRDMWNALDFANRSYLCGTVKSLGEGATKSGEALPIISGPEREYYIVTAENVKSRKHEALFAAAEQFEFTRINTFAVENFLYLNSSYNKSADLQIRGKKRKLSSRFRNLLCEYLAGTDDRNRTKIAEALGIEWKELLDEVRRRDDPPGIPVYCYNQPTDENFEMGLTQLIPRRPAGDVRSFLPKGHREPFQARYDWAEALFGIVPDGDGSDTQTLGEKAALKSRVSFDFCELVPEQAVDPQLPKGKAFRVIQGQPRASFDPFSLRRVKPRQDGDNRKAAAWIKEDAQISGYRRYPALLPIQQDLPLVSYGVESQATVEGSEMAALVRPLILAEYDCSIEFHNLHPLELGALLWSLSFGDREVFKHGGRPTKYRHVGGRLRNKGFGRLRPHSAKITLWGSVDADGNFNEQDRPDPATLMMAFEIAMGRFLDQKSTEPEQARITFYKSPTITALLNSSDMEWKSDNHIPSRDRGGMFHLPPVQDEEGGAKSDDIFKSFQNLRKFVYKAEPGYPPIGKTTFMDEFESPAPEPPEVGAAELEAARSLAEPYMENLTKSA